MKNKITPYIQFLSIFLVFFFVQCKKKPIRGCTDTKALNYYAQATEEDGSCEYEFQGPVNPSFESSGSWSGYGNWGRYTNTSFMPTNGIAYMKISPVFSSCSSTASAGIYQDNVSLNRSTTLSFDFSYGGTGVAGTGICSDSILTATINMLFTSNGTATLWSKTISSTPTLYAGTAKINTYEKLSERIVLPSLPDKGRLTIQVLLNILHNVPQNMGQPSTDGPGNFSFQIDNIKVQ